jgi:hypothetical protein
MALKKFAAQPWPRTAGWLHEGNSTELGRAIVIRAMADVGILETPLNSNRGTRIDAMAKRAGSPLGSWWCAIWAGAVFADCGALVPNGYPLTDTWLPYCVKEPVIGAAVLYGLKKKGPVVAWGDAHHIGIVVRLEPMVLTIEGNRGFAGTTNNGVAVDIGPMNRRDILGYFHPKAA